MNKLDLHLPSENVDMASDRLPAHQVSVSARLESVRRLVVLIPADSDHTSATRRVADLAKSYGAAVLFLGLCKEPAQELGLRRQLATLSALLYDARVCAEARIEIRTNWLEIITSNLQAGDMIVCFAEPRAGLFHRPVSQILQSNVKMPVYVLSDLAPQIPAQVSWLSGMTVWIGSIGIIAGAFLIQALIAAMPSDWFQTTLLILSVIAEAWAIKAWNSLFG